MKPLISWVLGLIIITGIIVPPTLGYRDWYAHNKRLREVTEGKFYRAGQLTADGLDGAITRLGIHTVINVQDEYPDPSMDQSYWNRHQVSEKALCDRREVRYVYLAPDLCSERNRDDVIPQV